MDTAWIVISELSSADWVTAIATLMMCGLTCIYVLLTRSMLKSQSDPCVIVTVVHDEDRRSVMQLVIRNIGAGVARDIRFELSRPLPAQAWGISTKDAEPTNEMKDGPLINGMPILGPGESRKIDWGQFGGISLAIGDSPVIVTCKFKKGNKEMLPVECPLEIKSFESTVAVESPASKIAKSLEKLETNISHFASGFKKIKIEVVAMPENDESED